MHQSSFLELNFFQSIKHSNCEFPFLLLLNPHFLIRLDNISLEVFQWHIQEVTIEWKWSNKSTKSGSSGQRSAERNSDEDCNLFFIMRDPHWL